MPGVMVAGEAAEIDVEEFTTTPVAAMPANWTVAPLLGVTDVTVGVTSLYVNWSPATFPDVPPEVTTCTSTTPGVSVAGDTAVIDVAELRTTPVAATPPKSTVAPLTKFVPVIATD